MEKGILENQPAPGPFFSPGLPWDSSKLVPEDTKVCSPKVSSCDPAICIIPSFQDPGLHHLIVTATKTAPNCHLPRL